jgi:hypothetical protein
VVCKKICILLERVTLERVICDRSMKNSKDIKFDYLINGRHIYRSKFEFGSSE